MRCCHCPLLKPCYFALVAARSAEKKTTLQESSEEPSEDLHPPSLVFSGSQTTNISEKLTQSAEPQRPEQSEKPAEKKEDATQQFGAFCFISYLFYLAAAVGLEQDFLPYKTLFLYCHFRAI